MRQSQINRAMEKAIVQEKVINDLRRLMTSSEGRDLILNLACNNLSIPDDMVWDSDEAMLEYLISRLADVVREVPKIEPKKVEVSAAVKSLTSSKEIIMNAPTIDHLKDHESKVQADRERSLAQQQKFHASHPKEPDMSQVKSLPEVKHEDLGLLLKSKTQDHHGYSYIFDHPDIEIRVIDLDRKKYRDATGKIIVEDPIYGKRKEKRAEDIVRLIRDPRTIFASTSGTRVLIHRTNNPELTWMSHIDAEIDIKQKTMKRVKSLASQYMLVSDQQLRIGVIANEKLESLLDGAMILRRSALKGMIKDYKGDRKYHKMMLNTSKIFSIRILCPLGMIKGHAFVVPDFIFDRISGKDLDLVVHETNVKSEVKSETWMTGLNPKSKEIIARTNLQYFVNLPFMRRDAEGWIDNELNRIRFNFFNDVQCESLKELVKSEIDMIEDDQLEFSPLLHYRWAAYWYAANKMGVRHSLTLRRNYFEALTGRLLKEKNGKVNLNIPIPCSRHCQVISRAMASMMGIDVEIPEGKIYYDDYYHVAVINNKDWVLSMKDHGGCDQDDLFTLIYRRDKASGKKIVIVVRTPNDIGEYAIYEPLIPSDCPVSTWYKSHTEKMEITWPATDLSDLPPRESSLNTEVEIKSPKWAGSEHRKYTREYVIEQFDRAVTYGTNPGSYVNAKILLSMVTGRQAKKMIATMETAIDACVQGGDLEAISRINTWSADLVQYMVDHGVVIDTVFAQRFSEETQTLMKTGSGFYTKLVQRFKKGVLDTKCWIEENIKHEMPSILRVTVDTKPEDIRLAKQMVAQVMLNIQKKAGINQTKEDLLRMIEQAKDPVLTTRAFAKVLMSENNKNGSQRSDWTLLSTECLWDYWLSFLHRGMRR